MLREIKAVGLMKWDVCMLREIVKVTFHMDVKRNKSSGVDEVACVHFVTNRSCGNQLLKYIGCAQPRFPRTDSDVESTEVPVFGGLCV